MNQRHCDSDLLTLRLWPDPRADGEMAWRADDLRPQRRDALIPAVAGIARFPVSRINQPDHPPDSHNYNPRR